jgi:hypothetical protein
MNDSHYSIRKHSWINLSRTGRSFSLVELLVVIAIFAFLLTLTGPILESTLYKTSNLLCVNNLKNLGTSTLIYADDWDGLYPQRARPGTYRGISGRFSYRVRGNQYNMASAMNPYLSSSSPTWVCALYEPKGAIVGNSNPDKCFKFSEYRDSSHSTFGNFGCLDHGLDHIVNNARTAMTYSFYGGVTSWKVASFQEGWAPFKDRLYVGDPFVITSNDGDHTEELNVLWSDRLSRPDDSGKGPFPRFMTYQAYHRPPPGSLWSYWRNTTNPTQRANFEKEGALAIFSGSVTNWMLEDCSVKIVRSDPGNSSKKADSDQFHYVRGTNKKFVHIFAKD